MGNAANNTSSGKIVYDSARSLFEGNIKYGTSLNDILAYISTLISDLYTKTAFDCIDLEDLGITCPDPNMTRECIILNYLIANNKDIQGAIASLQMVMTTINTSIGLFTDEKAKVNAAGVAGYLADKVTAPPGVITQVNDALYINGTVPIGFTASISRSRLNDFDGSGKGKSGTDVWGWAIRNGLNGTENVLGLFPRYTPTLAVAGTIDGKSDFTLDGTNIPSLTLPVTGTMSTELPNNLQLKIKVSTALYHFSGLTSHYVVDFPAGDDKEFLTDPVDLSHKHTFDLLASNVNVSPVAIPLVPRHFTEIPIQRITV